MIWKNTNDRFIAFFDIMGFKDLVYRNTHKSVESYLNKLKMILTEIQSYEDSLLNDPKFTGNPKHLFDYKNTVTKHSLFSDSIIIATLDDSNASAMKIIFTCAWLLGQCMKVNIPLKGALSFGKLTFDESRSIYFGKPLIDAYLLQEEINFYGALLDSSIEKYLAKNKLFERLNNLQEHISPLKSGKIKHYAIDWLNVLEKNDKPELWIRKFYTTVHGKPRVYVDNTLEFVVKYKKIK